MTMIQRFNRQRHRIKLPSFCRHFTVKPSVLPPHLEPRSARPPASAKADAPYHFYQNKVLEPYLKQSLHASTIRQYIMYGRHMTSDRLINSGNWVRNELLIRLAHRIRDFQQLPFIIGTNPNIEWPYRLYWGAFETLRKTPVIKTAEDNDQFCALLEDLLEDGQQVLPRMALGVTECASYYEQHDHILDRFLNRMIKSRISRRLLAEQHVTLTKACCGTLDDKWTLESLAHRYGSRGDQVGVFNTECSAKAIFQQAQLLVQQQYPSLPDIHMQGDKDITFAYIPDQLEHILYELLHNAVKYTIQQHSHPPIRVTMSSNDTDVFFRFSDQAGGIPRSKYERLWSYQERANNGDFTDFQHIPKMPVTLAERFKQQCDKLEETEQPFGSLGIGLIMSRVYAEYWGGELQVMTMDGYGTDAYVRIPRSGSLMENIGIDSTAQHRRHQHHHHHHHHHDAARQQINKKYSMATTAQFVLKGLPNTNGWSSSSIISS
ncbi:branched-chain alpha-ketoacid dehydrogenase [Halteromyces radiatus]|uniref:branched-chain alpha-ketoacid dehydrogenase n=1 Tax=Halteromyces radiatus TaxID=101107 RepID=UPI00221E8340|nr:branched-chain alpha-ketoacid dehydrogenase [Halteromyces radiatus]KAI8077875.1 branched-chain alpha-ketoacid dehydrogenase [Halteromyces radiatus]